MKVSNAAADVSARADADISIKYPDCCRNRLGRSPLAKV